MFASNPLKTLLAGLFGACLLGASAAHAAWPNDKPIEILVGFAAGGQADVLVRTMQPYLEKELGAKIVVIVKPGASGEITYTALTQAPPDGYTFSTFSLPAYVTMQISRKVRFEPKDIVPLARLVEEAAILVVNSNSPYKTLKDVAVEVKAHPRKVTLGGGGVGTDDHLAVMLFRDHAGLDFNYVPYPGGSDALVALLGNHIVVSSTTVSVVVRDPSIRAIAQLAPQRSPHAPDIPTALEQGYDVSMGAERGLAANVNVPIEIRKRFADAVEKVMKNPEFVAKARQLSLPLSYLPGEPWNERMQKRRVEYQAIWDKTPWTKP